MNPVAALRSLFFYLGYVLSLVVYASICVLIGWALPLKARYPFFLQWNRFAVWWLKVTCGVHFRVHGMELVPREPYVMLSNHQSPWETLFLYYHFIPMCAILKRELLRLPFFGWALGLLNPIPIDRSRRSSARRLLLAEGGKRLRDGFSVLVFPEGTRVNPGEARKYSAGGAELAISAGVKIVPLAHNAGLFWPAHRFLKRPGTIDLVVGNPIDTNGKDPRELTATVQAWARETQTRLGVPTAGEGREQEADDSLA